MKTFTSANLKTVFTYMFKGEDWQNKLLITFALMLVSFIIPILPLLALFGYLMKFVKNVIEGDGQPSLPEWDDRRDLIRNGFKLLGLSLIFSLSVIIIWNIGFGIIFSPFILMFMDSESGFMVPVGTFMLIGLFTAFGEYFVFGLSLAVVFLQSISICHVSVKGQFSALSISVNGGASSVPTSANSCWYLSSCLGLSSEPICCQVFFSSCCPS